MDPNCEQTHCGYPTSSKNRKTREGQEIRKTKKDQAKTLMELKLVDN